MVYHFQYLVNQLRSWPECCYYSSCVSSLGQAHSSLPAWLLGPKVRLSCEGCIWLRWSILEVDGIEHRLLCTCQVYLPGVPARAAHAETSLSNACCPTPCPPPCSHKLGWVVPPGHQAWYLTWLCGNLHPRIGEGNGTPLQYSCLENPMDGGAC